MAQRIIDPGLSVAEGILHSRQVRLEAVRGQLNAVSETARERLTKVQTDTLPSGHSRESRESPHARSNIPFPPRHLAAPHSGWSPILCYISKGRKRLVTTLGYLRRGPAQIPRRPENKWVRFARDK
jgi:hypothetical protein